MLLLSAVVMLVSGCAAPAPTAAPLPTPPPAVAPTATLPPEPAPTAGPLPILQTPRTPLPSPAGPPPEVVYQRGGELWSLALKAREAQPVARLPQGAGSFELGDPWALAPDGRHLALVQNAEGRAALYIIALPGAQMQQVGRYAGRVDALHWSHDSAQVAFVVNRRDERTGDLLEASLRLYDVKNWREATPYQQTFNDPDTVRYELWPLGWVPGNAAIYVALAVDRTGDPGTLYALDARGGELRLISQEYLLKGGQAVSPATSRVLLRSRSASGRASPLYVARAAPDGSLSEIALLSPSAWVVGAVAWRPDGQQVAVERLEAQAHGTYSGHVWLLAPGAEPRQLTDDPAFREEQPVWSPDGREVLFGRWLAAQPQTAGLWVWDSSTGSIELLDEAGARPQAASTVR